MHVYVARSAPIKNLLRNDWTHDLPTWKVSLLSTHMLLAVLVTALPMALSPAVADAAPKDVATPAVQPMFGRMFPELPDYDAPSDDALTALTCGQVPLSADCTLQTNVPSPNGPLMGPLFDQNIAAPTVPNDDNSVYYAGPCLGA